MTFVRLGCFVAFGALLASAVKPAGAQWIVTILQPTIGPIGSGANGVSGQSQGGSSVVGPFNGNYYYQACMWRGSPGSWVSLHPLPDVDQSSGIQGVSETQQVGTVGFTGGPHASVWSGTAATWVDLHPPAAAYSEAYGVGGGQQVGYVSILIGSPAAYHLHAALWSGSADSWVDLNPSGTNDSVAIATNGIQQVGYAAGSAALWSGTAESWVDLGAGHTDTQANALTDSVQVGIVGQHACLWRGSAASLVDLNPPGAVTSEARGASGMMQVGQVRFSWGTDTLRAILWAGTADSWVDLHALLPAGEFTYSSARAVWTDGRTTRVAGYAFNAATQRQVAVLWSRECASTCPADVDCSGALDTGDIIAFVSDWFALEPRADFNRSGMISVQDIFDFLAAYFGGCN